MKHAAPSDEEIAHDATYETMSAWVADRNRLIKWLARTFQYEDPKTGEIVFNDPIFPFYGLDGEHLYESQMNFLTWQIVIHDMSPEDAASKLLEILGV
jgi:hypothetical protein